MLPNGPTREVRGRRQGPFVRQDERLSPTHRPTHVARDGKTDRRWSETGLCGNPGLIPAHKTKRKISENGRSLKADGRTPPHWTVTGDPRDRVFMGLGKPDKVLLQTPKNTQDSNFVI